MGCSYNLGDRVGRRQNVVGEGRARKYFEEAEAEWRERGLSAEEAKRAARREAGSIAVARERASEYGWENNVKVFMDDLRFAARQLWKHPAFTVTAVLTLALGIGANTAIFTVVERVLLAPLSYRNSDRLALLNTYRSQIGRAIPRVTGPDGVDVREQSKGLEAVSLYGGGNLGVQLADHAAFAVVTMADANFARVFALRPVAGRMYTEADAKHAVMVSERFARDNFGGAQAAVGKVMRVEGRRPTETVGIPLAGRGSITRTGRRCGWPRRWRRSRSRGRRSTTGPGGLLRAGTEDASSGSRRSWRGPAGRLRAAYAEDNRGKVLTMVPLKEALTGDSRPTLMFLWAAAGLILLIACVNVMHLQLVRSMERQRELAIRRALGSSRWRVMQPVFLESLLVALMGGAAGVMLAFPTVRVLVSMAPKELPRTSEIHLNLWVLGFALGLAVMTAVVSAMLPAMRAA